MRVIEIASSWPAEIFIQRHLEAVTRAGLDVLCAAKPAGGSLQGKATIIPVDRRDGVVLLPDFDRMSWMDKLRVLGRASRSRSFFPSDLSLRRRAWLAEISRLQPDLIHFHNAQLAASLAWIAAELGLPYTVSVRGADVQEIPLRGPEQAQSIRAVLERAAGIQAVCNAFAGLPLLAGLEVSTIYTTVPLPETLEGYPDKSDMLRLMSVGRLHWRKGYPDLLVAVRRLLDSRMKVELTIFGSGPERDRLEYWVEHLELDGHVHLAGKTAPEQIRQAMINSHAYVQSSYAEGLSNALAEAMAYGCPVFATDVAGTAEAIEDGVTGRLLPVGEPEKWVSTLESIHDGSEMKRLRAAAFARAGEMFSAERHAQAFARLFERSAGKKVRPEIRVAEKVGNGEEADPSAREDAQRQTALVRGAWRWQNGIDLLIKELARQDVIKLFDLRLVGDGPQEDELRYLADLFGLGQEIFVVDGESCLEDLESKILVTCSEVSEFPWRVMVGGGEVACKDGREVVGVLRQAAVRER